jgi:ribosome-associated protein
MGGIVSIDLKATVLACAQILADHNAGDTVVLDLRSRAAWTDFFIIGSATSSTHMRGLLKHLDEHFAANDLTPLRYPRLSEDEQWYLLDMGDFVIHIMSLSARQFYELEKLWFEAESIPVMTKLPVN